MRVCRGWNERTGEFGEESGFSGAWCEVFGESREQGGFVCAEEWIGVYREFFDRRGKGVVDWWAEHVQGGWVCFPPVDVNGVCGSTVGVHD